MANGMMIDGRIRSAPARWELVRAWLPLATLWAVFVVVPDLTVRGAMLGVRYPVGLVGSALAWASAAALVAWLRPRIRAVAAAVAAAVAITLTVAVIGSEGYYAFFKTDVKALEWEFVLENPPWAWVLVKDALGPVQIAGALLGPPAIFLALWRAGAAPRIQRVDAARAGLALAVALAAITAIALRVRAMPGDLVGVRAIAFGTREHWLRRADPRSLPAPHRARLPEHVPTARPDVLVLINESVGRRESLGPGAQWPATAAFLARHADRAVQFPRASTLATATCVSIPTILSGLDPGSGRDDFARAPLAWHWARANGYRTALFSAQEYTIDFFGPFFLGEDAPDVAKTAPDYRKPAERVNELGVDDRLAVDAMLGDLASAPAGKPYFAVLQFNATHWPCWTPTLGVGRWRDSGAASSGPDPQRCAAATRFVDEQIARVLDDLERSGRLDRTLVFITSDHGEVLRPGRPMRHQSFYEDVLAIPFVVHLPAALARHVEAMRANSRERVTNLDIQATLLDAWGEWPIAAAPDRPAPSGVSLLHPFPPRVVVSSTDSAISKETPGFALYHGAFKWIFSDEAGARLYDLEADPDELHDLAAGAPKTEIDALRRELSVRPSLRAFAEGLAPELLAGR